MGFIAEDQHLTYKTLIASNEYTGGGGCQAKLNLPISTGNRNPFNFI